MNRGPAPVDFTAPTPLKKAPVNGTRKEPATLWAPELAKPLPPMKWVSEGLTMAPGRAIVLAGEGATRKGWLAMAMQVCAAADRKLLGRFAFREGLRSCYFDYEQTERPSRERFQALSRGIGVDLASLEQRLGYRWRPIPSWAPKGTEARTEAIDALCWHTEGLDFVIVDSVRACSAGIEENSVFASAPFDLATEVSERTGVAVCFLDHAGKPPRDEPTGSRTRKHSQRGHSSKLDASQTVFIFSASKGEPTLVTCERSQIAAEEAWPADFQFTLVSSNGGLVLQEIAMAPEGATHTPTSMHDEVKAKVRTFLRLNPGIAGADLLAKKLEMQAKPVRDAVNDLEAEKLLRRGDKAKDETRYQLFLTEKGIASNDAL